MDWYQIYELISQVGIPVAVIVLGYLAKKNKNLKKYWLFFKLLQEKQTRLEKLYDDLTKLERAIELAMEDGLTPEEVKTLYKQMKPVVEELRELYDEFNAAIADAS